MARVNGTAKAVHQTPGPDNDGPDNDGSDHDG